MKVSDVIKNIRGAVGSAVGADLSQGNVFIELVDDEVNRKGRATIAIRHQTFTQGRGCMESDIQHYSILGRVSSEAQLSAWGIGGLLPVNSDFNSTLFKVDLRDRGIGLSCRGLPQNYANVTLMTEEK